LTEVFPGIPQSLQTNVGILSRVQQHRQVSDLFQLNIQLSSYHWRSSIWDTDGVARSVTITLLKQKEMVRLGDKNIERLIVTEDGLFERQGIRKNVNCY
jgi:hypothetical protein